MATTYEQFRASLGNSLARRALGVEISDHEANRVLSDENLCRAYYSSWSSIPHPQLGHTPHVIPPAPAILAAQPHSTQALPPYVTATPAPIPAAAPAPRKKMGCCSVVALFLVIGALILLALVVAANLRDPASESSSNSSEVNPQQQPLASDPNAAADQHAIDNGWQVLVSGDLYAKAHEPGTFTCGYSNCLWYSLTSRSGCAGGVYVQADVLREGTAFDWTNTVTASIPAGETIQFQLESLNDNGDQFRITEARCMG